MTVVSESLETTITTRASVGADGQRQSINHLHRALVFSASLNNQVPDGSFHLPQVSGLADKRWAVTQSRKEVTIVAVEVGERVFVSVEYEGCAAEFHHDDLLIAQGGREAAAPDGVSFCDHRVVFNYQTVDGSDKSVSIN